MTFFSKETRHLTGERYFGIDLAKRESQVAVLDANGVQIESKRFATTRESFLALAAEFRIGDVAALEVTTNSTSIARLLRDNSPARVIVSNPIKTKVIAQAKIKTDKIDARVLAELARVGYLPEVWLPDEDTEALRQFITDRTSLVRRRTECKNTIHSVLHRNLVRQEKTDLFGATGRRWLESVIRGVTPATTPVAELDRMRIGSLLNEIDRIDALVADLESVIASYVALLRRCALDLSIRRLLTQRPHHKARTCRGPLAHYRSGRVSSPLSRADACPLHAYPAKTQPQRRRCRRRTQARRARSSPAHTRGRLHLSPSTPHAGEACPLALPRSP